VGITTKYYLAGGKPIAPRCADVLYSLQDDEPGSVSLTTEGDDTAQADLRNCRYTNLLPLSTSSTTSRSNTAVN
jgi:hypothetical protein